MTNISEVLDQEVEMKLEVLSFNNLGIDKVIGECSLGIPQRLKPETVIDSWFDLKLKQTKSNKKEVTAVIYFVVVDLFFSFTSIFSNVSLIFFCLLYINTSLVFISGCQCPCRKCTHSNVLFMP
jgi:hypothetical protein